MMRDPLIAIEERAVERRSRVLVCDPIDPEGLELLEAHASV